MTQRIFLGYNEHGRVIADYSIPSNGVFYSPDPELSWLEVLGDNDTTSMFSHYVDVNTLSAVPLTPLTLAVDSPVIANGIDEAVISGIPNPCDVTWPDGEVTTVTDGEIVFNVDLEGQYTFKFDSIPYIIEDVTIEAITPT